MRAPIESRLEGLIILMANKLLLFRYKDLRSDESEWMTLEVRRYSELAEVLGNLICEVSDRLKASMFCSSLLNLL